VSQAMINTNLIHKISVQFERCVSGTRYKRENMIDSPESVKYPRIQCRGL
jgi:hypothetical protein